jgi:hypothetical protein
VGAGWGQGASTSPTSPTCGGPKVHIFGEDRKDNKHAGREDKALGSSKPRSSKVCRPSDKLLGVIQALAKPRDARTGGRAGQNKRHCHTHTHTHTHQKRAAAQAQVAQAVGSVVRKTENRAPPAERAEAKNADRPTQGLPASGFREPGRKRGGNNNTTIQYFILAVIISRYSISCCRDTLSASDSRSSYSHVFFVETPRRS